MNVRGDLQAVDMAAVRQALEASDLFYEGNPFVGKALVESPLAEQVPMVTAFLAPLCREEIESLRAAGGDVQKLVTDVMRRKLLRRTRNQKTNLSLPDLENIETRAGSAWRELELAPHFEHVIPCHDGEDSENWDAFYYPLGDARKALHAFVELLQGRVPETVETWEPLLFED
jgi:guanylate kinase